MVGSAFVRNEYEGDPAVGSSNAGIAVAPEITDGLVKLRPPSVDFTIMIWLGFSARQTAYTWPLVGLTPSDSPWLLLKLPLILNGFSHVLPQSSDRVNISFVRKLPLDVTPSKIEKAR